MTDYRDIDPDAKRVISWPWLTFLEDRSTGIDSATVTADDPDQVDFLSTVDETAGTVSVMVQVHDPGVLLTCHIVCSNGEEEDWEMKLTTRDH